MLEELSDVADDVRQPVVDVSQETKGRVVHFDAAATLSSPAIKDLANGVLFRERHLNVGKQIDNFELDTLDGNQWSLKKDVGTVTVIQFSFKGCGPCERMYPFLRKLKDDHGSKVDILSVLADRDLADARDSVESGKIIWHAYWDGRDGPMSTLWSVESFPSIYIVDSQRTVQAIGLRGEDLVRMVEELLQSSPKSVDASDI